MALHSDDPDTFDIISFATGGGGLDVGVELAIPTARTVCMVEREAFCVSGLVQAMEAGTVAPCPVWSDARTFDGRPFHGLVDGLIGGIPCQPWSEAGGQLGEEDERDLWPDTLRAILDSGAWVFLLENVGNMLSLGGVERVCRDLAAHGFACEVGLFAASEVGDTQERERVFVLAVKEVAGGGRFGGAARLPAAAGGDGLGAEPTEPFDHCSGLVQDAVVGGEGVGRGEGRPEPILHGRGRDTATGAGGDVGRADGERWGAGAGLREAGAILDGPVDPGSGHPMVGADGRGHNGGPPSEERGEVGRIAFEWASSGPLFPPGPEDLDTWREVLKRWPGVEPAIHRNSDGLANRSDSIRRHGNGVVPLQAAYAIRTLAARLAARGSSAAARLVRLMV